MSVISIQPKSRGGVLAESRRIDVQPECLEEQAETIVRFGGIGSAKGLPADKFLEFRLVLIGDRNIDSVAHKNGTSFYSPDVLQ